MQYADGQEVRIGDRVKLGADDNGVVVCSIDTNEYSDDYPLEKWSYLERGVMIEFPEYGLIHYEETDPDLELISRSNQSPQGA
ncbi:hypothetical protein [Denitromonas iodatirespirans]|uniref:Uncharacterized protein n=1 Tax=Denitromonas iodatirespirans TaxID=2795389 RepID=A0A944DE96_DENI1|nr:hypothetical protein [Denitromonas iodatirespirans]MBT0962732.1 hypothetical protein [Denitromonas iodatirespirans]